MFRNIKQGEIIKEEEDYLKTKDIVYCDDCGVVVEKSFAQKIFYPMIGEKHFCQIHKKPFDRIIWGERIGNNPYPEWVYLKEKVVDKEGKLITNKK